MRENKVFCIYYCFSISHYVRGGRKSHFRHICIHKQSILTKQQNNNILVQISFSYLRYTDRFLDLTCSSLVRMVLRCNIIRASRETKKERLSYRKKVLIRISVRGNTFWLDVYFSMSFLSHFCLLHSPFQVTHLLNGPYKNA